MLSLWNSPPGSSFCTVVCVCLLKQREAQVLAEEVEWLSVAGGLVSSMILAWSCHSYTQQAQRDTTTSLLPSPYCLTFLMVFSPESYDWCQCSLAVCWLIISEIFAAGWWAMRPLAGMRWCCAIDFWRNCAWSYKTWWPAPLVFAGFVFSPCLIFLIRINFERQSLSSTPHCVGLASLYLPLLVKKNLCQWELKLSSRLFSNPVLLSNSKMVCVSWCMCKIGALFLHKC